MTGAAIVRSIREQGGWIAIEGKALRITPPSLATDDLIKQVRANAKEVVEFLRTDESPSYELIAVYLRAALSDLEERHDRHLAALRNARVPCLIRWIKGHHPQAYSAIQSALDGVEGQADAGDLANVRGAWERANHEILCQMAAAEAEILGRPDLAPVHHDESTLAGREGMT